MGKFVRLILFHPQNLRGSKACKSNVCGVFRQLILADFVIQILCFLLGTSVIPEDSRADHLIIFIQSYKAVHLTSKADSGNFFAVNILCQLLHSLHALSKPVLRILFRPARMREK